MNENAVTDAEEQDLIDFINLQCERGRRGEVRKPTYLRTNGSRSQGNQVSISSHILFLAALAGLAATTPLIAFLRGVLRDFLSCCCFKGVCKPLFGLCSALVLASDLTSSGPLLPISVSYDITYQIHMA